MLNATYLQYWRASSLDENPLNRRVLEEAFSSERGAILVGRTPVAESEPSDDRYEFQRTYPQPYKYAPITGWFSYFSQAGVEESQNEVLSGEDSRLFVTRLVDLFSNSATKGGSVQLTLDPAAQNAAFDGLAALGSDVEGAVVAIEPNTGRILAMVSLPTYDPNDLAGHDFSEVADNYEALQKQENEPLLNRAIQTRLAPGSTFKLVTAAAAIEELGYDADSQVPGGATYQLPLTSDDSGLIDNEGRDCGTDKIPFTQAMGQSCNTTFARLAVDVGADAMLDQAEAFGFNTDYLEDLVAAGAVELPGGDERARDRPVRHRPVRGAGDPAADGDGVRRHRQRRHRDAPLPRRRRPHPRARGAPQDRAGGALPGDRRRHRRRADRPDGLHRRRRHRLRRPDPGRRGGRQDRHRAERRGRRPAVRLVHLLRPGRGPRRSRSR